MATAPFSLTRAPAASTAFGLIPFLGRVSYLLRQSISISQQFDARQAQIRALNRLSDAELADRGLTRDRITHHVYADLLAL